MNIHTSLYFVFIFSVYTWFISENLSKLHIENKMYSKYFTKSLTICFLLECIVLFCFNKNYKIMLWTMILSRILNILMAIFSFKNMILFIFTTVLVIGQFFITQLIYSSPIIKYNYHYPVYT